MDPKQTIKKNLERRSKDVDILELYKDIPKPTWVELSLIDVCNRKCVFCPKSNDDIAPDTYQQMSRTIIDKIHDQLSEMNFSGTISLCGYGEPLLHKDINYIVKKLSNIAKVEVITNGDPLTSKKLQELYLAKASKVLVSMYDGPEQIEKFEKISRQANVPKEILILRDRWYDKHNDFGVKLTNRAGTIIEGEQEKLGKYNKCFYPTYQFLIDWNGSVFLCPQDWHRRVSMGNMMQETLFEIWTGKIISKFRKNLVLGNRCDNPCTKCNADGTLLGVNHAKKWKEIYKI
ncbi:MAG: Molybdenum cofactor biosynthesis enzyme MoaA [Pelagibacterales bacterium]|jgi:radical SAM protein with 4Fe4S-binding SPASM domain|nr:Molybdenum cofactor biosynthesis enzyme MoaA [Pelagibacterales bacterium]